SSSPVTGTPGAARAVPAPEGPLAATGLLFRAQRIALEQDYLPGGKHGQYPGTHDQPVPPTGTGFQRRGHRRVHPNPSITRRRADHRGPLLERKSATVPAGEAGGRCPLGHSGRPAQRITARGCGKGPLRRASAAPQRARRGMVLSSSSGVMLPTILLPLPGGGEWKMLLRILPITCISQGLQSNFRVSTSSPCTSCMGATLVRTPVTPLACFGQRLKEKRRQCLVIITGTSPASSWAS